MTSKLFVFLVSMQNFNRKGFSPSLDGQSYTCITHTIFNKVHVLLLKDLMMHNVRRIAITLVVQLFFILTFLSFLFKRLLLL